MFELTVQHTFWAAHAIEIAGQREESHAHNWIVVVVVGGTHLDADGLLCDFHELEAVLDGIVAPWQDRDLNAIAPFKAVNPTAENVAATIGERLARALPEGVELRSVAVTEAPGCVATYRPV